jgi:predicted GTPase
MNCLLGCLLPSTSKKIHSGDSCAPTVPPALQQRPRVILVGSTGDGKSRFGSYLINPDAAVNVKAPAFEFSESSEAVTSHLSCKPAVFKGKAFDIVDSPGLGEHPAADLEHTIQLLQLPNNSRHIAAIIFCFR